jgi:hypothetical protein
MKGVSAIIVIILILMITVSLAALAYVFFTGAFTATTQEAEKSVKETTTSMSARMKIDSIDSVSNYVFVRNIGDIDLTDFEVYVENERDPNPTLPAGNTIAPQDVGRITVTSPPSLDPGDRVKVTSAEGAIATRIA